MFVDPDNACAVCSCVCIFAVYIYVCMYLFTTLPHPHGHWQLQELQDVSMMNIAVENSRKTSGCLKLIYHFHFLFGQCAECNAGVFGAFNTYLVFFDKKLVLCVGIVVPVQESRPRYRSR